MWEVNTENSGHYDQFKKPARYVTCRLEHWKALHGFPGALHRWGLVRALPYHCETMMNEGAWTWTVNIPKQKHNKTKTDTQQKKRERENKTKSQTDRRQARTYTLENASVVMEAAPKSTYLNASLMAWREQPSETAALKEAQKVLLDHSVLSNMTPCFGDEASWRYGTFSTPISNLRTLTLKLAKRRHCAHMARSNLQRAPMHVTSSFQ